MANLSTTQAVDGFLASSDQPGMQVALGIADASGSNLSTFYDYSRSSGGSLVTAKWSDTRLNMTSYGDSLTNGDTWQDTVADALNLSHTKLGVGGRRVTGTSGMAAQASVDTISTATHFVVAMGGTNDWSGNVALGAVDSTNIEEFYGAMNLMIERITLRIPEARLVLMSPPYSENIGGDWTGFTDKLTNGEGLTLGDYSDAIRTAATNSQVPFLDHYHESWNENNITLYMTNDGNYIHPNATGGAKMGTALRQKFLTL